MKSEALELAKGSPNSWQGRNILREYLQHLVLRIMFEQGVYRQIVFHGGTALRILHKLDRFSEDLDFHTLQPELDLDYQQLERKLHTSLNRQGYTLSPKSSLNGTVKTIWLNFENLLAESAMAVHPSEKLRVKVDIDSHPPLGFTIEASTVNMYFPIALQHHDLSSFLAGKLHAVFQRKYAKGRDYYDLFYYLGRWVDIEPNLPYLNNALQQTGWTGAQLNAVNWKSMLLEHLGTIDFAELQKDLQPFVEMPADISLISYSSFERLLT